MGRGRQKAKQTKVARKLKYYSPDTDLSALARELSGQQQSSDNGYQPYDATAIDGEEDERAESGRNRERVPPLSHSGNRMRSGE